MNVLVLNCGSSSVKFQVIDTDLERIESDSDRQLAGGEAERIGGHGLLTLQATGKNPVRQDAPLRDHRAAIDMIMRWVVSPESAASQPGQSQRHPGCPGTAGPRHSTGGGF
jgi:acetate kinase